MWYDFEVRACARAKTDIMTECTANRLLLPYFILTICIAVSPKTIAPGIVKEMPLYTMVKNYSYVLSTSYKIVCSDLLNYLQKRLTVQI